MGYNIISFNCQNSRWQTRLALRIYPNYIIPIGNKVDDVYAKYSEHVACPHSASSTHGGLEYTMF